MTILIQPRCPYCGKLLCWRLEGKLDVLCRHCRHDVHLDSMRDLTKPQAGATMGQAIEHTAGK